MCAVFLENTDWDLNRIYNYKHNSNTKHKSAISSLFRSAVLLKKLVDI